MKKKMMKKGDLNKDGKMSGYEKKRSAEPFYLTTAHDSDLCGNTA